MISMMGCDGRDKRTSQDPETEEDGFDPLCLDAQVFVPEDEFLAGLIHGATKVLFQIEQEIREANSLDKKQDLIREMEYWKNWIRKRWVKMEDPTFVLTHFFRKRAEGDFLDVDLPRWTEALTWPPPWWDEEKEEDTQ